MSLERKQTDVVTLTGTSSLVMQLLSKISANKSGTDGKRSFAKSHNPVVRELAASEEVLTAVQEHVLCHTEHLQVITAILEGLAGRPESLRVMLQMLDED